MKPPRTSFLSVPAILIALVIALGGCRQAALETKMIPLMTLNDSGVTGAVTLTALDARRTQVEIRVDPAGHADMPSHIHPGTCASLIPQPKYPLQNVMGGHSVTIVTAALPDLLKGGLAVNIHRSNQDLATYTACAELR